LLAHQFKAAARTIGPIRHTAARSLESPAKRGRSEDFDARGKGADTLEVKDDVGEWLSLLDEAKKDARDYHKTCERIKKRHRYARPHADALPRARRIVAPNGLSHHERPLLTESLDHLRQRGPCVFVSIEAGRSPDAERQVRSLARRVKSDIALRQGRARMRRVYSVSVFEALGRDGSPKFGANAAAVVGTARMFLALPTCWPFSVK